MVAPLRCFQSPLRLPPEPKSAPTPQFAAAPPRIPARRTPSRRKPSPGAPRASPQISPNPDEPILLTPAAIVLSLATANHCNKAR